MFHAVLWMMIKMTLFSCCRLYQPSSRRPVAFSPSAEMGLTDIEMSHNLDFDDPFFDDRQYEMVYEVSLGFILL